MPHGATREEWVTFDQLLGLTEDLLPVVSNPGARISEGSKMKGLGKTPSRYNNMHEAVGIPDWTSLKTGTDDVARWRKQDDYGICIQTRLVRAIDIDITDPGLADEITAECVRALGVLPCRFRSNSPKRLLAFRLPGLMMKRTIRTENGIIEFLANGQQFVAAGTHPSGARYEWRHGLPEEFPEVPLPQFEDLWAKLIEKFGIDDYTAKESTKREVLKSAIADDPIAQALYDKEMVLSVDRDGKMHILCPWSDEHTSESAESSTTYFPPHTGGYANGNFKCLHAHCEHRHVGDLAAKLDVTAAYFDDLSEFDALAAGGEPGVPAGAEDFDEIPETDSDGGVGVPAETAPANRFALVRADEFSAVAPTPWLIRDVLPQAGLAVMYGASGSGKSFMSLDMAFAIALGEEWRGKRTKKGRVVYVAAEGAGGVRKRLKAHSQQYGTDLAAVDLRVIPAAPNMLEKRDALDVAKAILEWGKVSLVIVDTWAQVLPGANENSGEDISKALAHCAGIHRATGALVLLIHHSGKDEAKGARGWSGLRAAADAEIEVTRSDELRCLQVTKMKDGEDGAEFGFRLLPVTIGLDEDDELVTSCVVEHAEHTKKEMRASGGDRKMGLAQSVAVDTIESLFDLGEDQIPIEQAVVAVLNASAEGTRRGNVVRVIDNLVKKGVFASERGFLIRRTE